MLRKKALNLQLRQNNSIVLRPACRQKQDIVTTTITEDMYQLTAFLCGHFHRNNDVTEEQLHSDNWTLRLYTDDEKHSLNRIFYSEFVDFFTEQCRILSMSVDTTLQVSFRDNLYTYRIDEISVYQMPLGMTLFSVRVKMTVADLNDVTVVLSSLRMIDSYAQGANKSLACGCLRRSNATDTLRATEGSSTRAEANSRSQQGGQAQLPT